jgi:hypothetical protein
MTIGRRAVLKTLVGTGVCAVAGAGSYGYLYERHAIGVTHAIVPVVGLPPALAGLRIGFLTDVHRSHWVSHSGPFRHRTGSTAFSAITTTTTTCPQPWPLAASRC